MSPTGASMEFRLRARWVADALEEANEVVSAEKTVTDEAEDSLAAIISAFLEVATSFDACWKRFLDSLERTGRPGSQVREALRFAMEFTVHSRALGSMLIIHSQVSPEELKAVADMITVTEKTVRAIEPATSFPAFDPERIRQRMEEPEDSENLEDVFARVSAGGPI